MSLRLTSAQDSVFGRRLAAIVSWIGHPLVFATISMAIVVTTQSTGRSAFAIVLSWVFAMILPMAILLLLGVRSGRWQDADVSQPEERRRFYPIAIPMSAVGTALMWLAGAPGYILRGGVVTLVLLIVAGIVNLRFKISLHTLFAAFCTVVLFRINAVCGISALILAGLVFWSRLVLSRHTVAETIAGVVLGCCGGIATAWLAI